MLHRKKYNEVDSIDGRSGWEKDKSRDLKSRSRGSLEDNLYHYDGRVILHMGREVDIERKVTMISFLHLTLLLLLDFCFGETTIW